MRDPYATDPDAPARRSRPTPGRDADAADDLDMEWVDVDDEGGEEPEEPVADRSAPEAPRPPASGTPPDDDGAERVLDADGPAETAAAKAGDADAGDDEEQAHETDLPDVPGVSDDAERAAIVAEVLRDQERRRSLFLRWPVRRRTKPAVQAASAFLLAAALWVWFLPPSWLEPEPPPPVPTELQDAGLRLGIYLQAQQIEAFRRRSGRLPDVLAETGDPLPGLHYRRVNAREYLLRGATPERALTYDSTDSLEAFLSNAHRVVGFGAGP